MSKQSRLSRSARTALRPAPQSRGIEHGRGRYGRRRQDLDFGVGAATVTEIVQRVDNSQQLSMAQSYELNVKSIKGVDPKYQKAHLCAAIHVDDKLVHTTHPKEASVAMWNDTTTL
ncbi:hypothetical protein B0H14DRAFT_3485891 [Mycena olivaceomarginata]|nr:hypothetical protein B0H14DRAFT_3485891 [Mycena olivaceomarginata]